jgi:hypothetical protein
VIDPAYELGAGFHSYFILQSPIILVGSKERPPYLESEEPPLTIENVKSTPSSPEHSGSCVILPARMTKDAALEILNAEIFVLCIGEQTVCFPGKGGYVVVTLHQARLALEKALDLCAPFQ